jgi:hypothetical protein
MNGQPRRAHAILTVADLWFCVGSMAVIVWNARVLRQ